MKKIKITLILLFACVCCCILVNLVVGLLLGTSHKAYIPTEGLWYCEAVDIMLSFEEGYSSYFINQGKEVSCIWENDVGSKVIMVVCQEKLNGDFAVGDLIFCGEYVRLDNREYVVQDIESGEIYTFVRQ